MSFAERFCAARQLAPAEYAPAVFRAALYPHARIVAPFLRLVSPHFFSADFDAIDDVGRVLRYSEFSLTLAEFQYHPMNRGILRRWLRVRISTTRLHVLVRDAFGVRRGNRSDDQGTHAPFAGAEERGRAADAPNEAPAS